MKQVLTVDEVADRLSVKPKTVYEMLKKGQLRGVRAGRLWRVPLIAFEDYLKGRGEALSNEDMAAVREGLQSIQRGDFISLSRYESERGL